MFLIDSKCYIALIYYRKAIKKKKKSTCPYRYILLADLCFYSKTIMDLKKKNVKMNCTEISNECSRCHIRGVDTGLSGMINTKEVLFSHQAL